MALAAQGKSRLQGREARHCFNCGWKGHIAANCRSERRERRGTPRHEYRGKRIDDDDDSSAFACPPVAPTNPITSGTINDVLLTLSDDPADDPTDFEQSEAPTSQQPPVEGKALITRRSQPWEFATCPPSCPSARTWIDEDVKFIEAPSTGPRGREWDWIRAE